MILRTYINGLAIAVALMCGVACNSTRITDTSRTGLEQILVSNAIDRSLDEFDLTGVNGQRIFVDDKRLECSDKGYVIGSLRRRLLANGASLAEKPDDASIVVEAFSGGVGTDRTEGFLGVPAASIPGPIPVRVPEVKLFSQQTHYGTAKICLVAYDAKSRASLGMGGVSLARSNNSSWSMLGIGPFSSGSIPKELSMASQETPTGILKRRMGIAETARPRVVLVEPNRLSGSVANTIATPPIGVSAGPYRVATATNPLPQQPLPQQSLPNSGVRPLPPVSP